MFQTIGTELYKQTLYVYIYKSTTTEEPIEIRSSPNLNVSYTMHCFSLKQQVETQGGEHFLSISSHATSCKSSPNSEEERDPYYNYHCHHLTSHDHHTNCTMIPTARCLTAKPAGFFKRSADELSRLSKMGMLYCPPTIGFPSGQLFQTRLTPLLYTAWNTEALHTPTKPYILLDFEDDSAVAGCKTMADRAVGGFSTANLDYIPADRATRSPAHARFHGSISTKLPNNWRVERTGTAHL
jgi:hypothetical protein